MSSSKIFVYRGRTDYSRTNGIIGFRTFTLSQKIIVVHLVGELVNKIPGTELSGGR